MIDGYAWTRFVHKTQFWMGDFALTMENETPESVAGPWNSWAWYRTVYQPRA